VTPMDGGAGLTLTWVACSRVGKEVDVRLKEEEVPERSSGSS
jgi:hypothetical protein